MPEAPHVERLVRLVDGLETPVVIVRGWPGSGRSALLEALVERPSSLGVAPEDLREGGAEAVRRAVAEGVEQVVCHSLPRVENEEGLLAELAEALPTGCRLVVATAVGVPGAVGTGRGPSPGLLWGMVTPRDLALTAGEAGALWRRVTGRSLDPEEAAHVVRITDGWYRVLRLAAEASGGSIPADAEEVAALPAVADFLRHRVLAGVPGDQRRQLATGPDGWVRLPAPLAALLSAVGLPEVAEAAEDEREIEADRGRKEGEAVERPVGPRFRLRLLGRPEVYRESPDGTWRRLRFSLRRGFRILAYVATAPERRAAPEELTEEIWPEADRLAIERNFHPTLSRLRRDLRDGAPADEAEAELIVYRDGVYALDPAAEWWIDAEELGRELEEGRSLVRADRDRDAVEVLEACWRLYRGPLLDGVYDAWAAVRREEAQRRHLALLSELGAAYERLGRLESSVDAYRALLADDPLQEPAHVALMALYARQGRRDLVRRQYDRMSHLLRSELGVEPLPETAEQYHRLMTERG